MDIQVSSNFERLLFDLAGRDAPALAAMMAEFERTRALAIPADTIGGARALFTAARIDADTMATTMRWANQCAGQLIDPHTAIGLAAARGDSLDPAIPVVTLATAHPSKFREAVERATGIRPALPPRLGGLFDRQERYDTLPATLAAVKAYVFERTP